MININDEESDFNSNDIMKACQLLKEEGNRHFEKGKYDLAFASYHSCLASVDQMKLRPKQYETNEVLENECILFGDMANTLWIMAGSEEKINKDKLDYYKTNKYPQEMNYFFEMFNKYSSTNSFIQLLGANLFITRALKRKPTSLKYLIWRIQILKKLNLETMFKYVLEILKHNECDEDIFSNMRSIIVNKLDIIKDWKTIDLIMSDFTLATDYEILAKSGEYLLNFFDFSKIKNKKLLEERKESKKKFLESGMEKKIGTFLINTKIEYLIKLAEKIFCISNQVSSQSIDNKKEKELSKEKANDSNISSENKEIDKNNEKIDEGISNLNLKD